MTIDHKKRLRIFGIVLAVALVSACLALLGFYKANETLTRFAVSVLAIAIVFGNLLLFTSVVGTLLEGWHRFIKKDRK